MPLLSVVIPAFNCGEFINECLSSVLFQSLRDWECIIVDDGSTDNTFEIAETFRKQDSRFKLFRIPNSGAAKIPRDYAISQAQSSFILALDADDYLQKDALSILIDRQRESHADIVIINLHSVSRDGRIVYNKCPAVEFDKQQKLSGAEAASLTIGQWTIPGNGLIAKKLYLSRVMIPNLMNADEFDSRQVLYSANVVVFSEAIYYYRRNENSITTKLSSKTFESIHVNRLLVEFVREKYGSNSELFKTIKNYAVADIFGKRCLLYQINTLTINERRKIESDLCEFHKFLKKIGVDGLSIKPRIYMINYTVLTILAWIRSKQKIC